MVDILTNSIVDDMVINMVILIFWGMFAHIPRNEDVRTLRCTGWKD